MSPPRFSLQRSFLIRSSCELSCGRTWPPDCGQHGPSSSTPRVSSLFLRVFVGSRSFEHDMRQRHWVVRSCDKRREHMSLVGCEASPLHGRLGFEAAQERPQGQLNTPYRKRSRESRQVKQRREDEGNSPIADVICIQASQIQRAECNRACRTAVAGGCPGCRRQTCLLGASSPTIAASLPAGGAEGEAQWPEK